MCVCLSPIFKVAKRRDASQMIEFLSIFLLWFFLCVNIATKGLKVKKKILTGASRLKVLLYAYANIRLYIKVGPFLTSSYPSDDSYKD